MIIGYARISSEEQAIDANALVKQIARLREAGAIRVFYDVAQRTNDKRKGVTELISWIQANRVDKLLFTRLDRVSASVILFYELANVCRDRNTKMVAIDDPIDMDSVGGEMSVDVRLAVAKHEVKMLSLRVTKDIQARRKRHKPHYTPPFGYKVVGEYHDRYELDRCPVVCLIASKKELTVADVARLAVETYLEVKSCRKAITALNEILGITLRKPNRYYSKETRHTVDGDSDLNKISNNQRCTKQPGLGWSANGFQTWLHNPVLAGGTAYDNLPTKQKNRSYKKLFQESNIVWNTHPEEALITIAERQKIMEITARNRNNKWGGGSPKQNSLYSGLIRCKRCGSSCYVQCSQVRKKTGEVVVYYQCNNFYKNRLCDNNQMINNKQIESQLIPYLTSAADKLMHLTVEVEEEPESEEILTLRKQLAQLEAIPGKNPVIIDAIDTIKSQIQSMVIIGANKRQQLAVNKDQFIKAFSDPLFWILIDNPDDKKRLLNECVSEFYVDGKSLISVKLKI
jgi:DNA invertase Pin-like site-specific DNA recombinase